MNVVPPLTPGRDELIEKHLRMVDSIVHCIVRQKPVSGLERDDLIQEGTIGLIKAVDSFDPSRGVAFRTWATTCIANAVRQAVHTAAKGCPFDRSPETVAIDTASERSAFAGTLISEDRALMEAEDRTVVCQLLPKLPDAHRRAVELYFFADLSKADIARRLNCSRMHAGRLVESGLQMLRALAAEGLDQ